MISLPHKKIGTDLKKIRYFSSLVEKNLSKFESKNDAKIGKLSLEELQDINQILQLADYMLCKYETKKEVQVLLKQFVEMINNSANSMDLLNDEIAELIVSAENSLERVKEVHSNVSENYALGASSKKNQNNLGNESKNGTNNFTKSTIPIYPQAYLGKSKILSEQVI